jgi:hypothetical protein
MKKETIFNQRLDFYWKLTAMYSVVLIIYALIKGTIVEGKFTIVLYDPFVILLLLIILFTVISLLFKMYNKKKLIIGEDYIEFVTKSRRKKFEMKDIEKIAIYKQKIIKMPAPIQVIKVKIKNRLRILRIRPSTFYNEDELIQKMTELSNKIKHQ